MIYNKYLDSDIDEKMGSVLNTLRKVINIKNLVFVLIAILLSTKTFIGDFKPFNYVMLATASAFEVPLLLVLLPSVIGLAVAKDVSSIILLVVFFLLYNLVTAIVNISGMNKKYSIFVKFEASIAILQLVYSFITGALFTDLFNILSSIVICGIMYLVMATGLNVILNIRNGFVYTKEESIMMMVTLAMILSILNPIALWGFKVLEIVALVTILIYGWGNGALLGATTGLMMGLTYSCLCETSMSFVVAMAFSGFIAGFLRRFGKLAVIIPFIIGNIYIIYNGLGSSHISIIVCETLIASVVLFFMPKFIERKLDNLFDLGKGLEAVRNNLLSPTKEAKEKIGAVSEVFESLSEITVPTSKETEKETADVIKKYILGYVNNKCISCSDMDECIDKENLDETAQFLAEKLENGEPIEHEMLKFDCKHSKQIIDDIYNMYTNMRITRVLKLRELENTEKVARQYKEVSKLLDNIANDLKEGALVKDASQQKLRDELKFAGYNVYEDEFEKTEDLTEYTFVTDILTNIDKQKKTIVELASNILEQSMTVKLILNISKTEKSKIKLISTPKYSISTEIVSENKTGEEVSGDTYLQTELNDLRKLTVISDGVGSGEDASKSSTAVVNMLDRLLSGGFSEEKAIEIVNNIVKLKGEDELYASLDAAIINQRNGECYFIKLGAAPTYLIADGKVVVITSNSIPVGLVEDNEFVPICKKLKEGDFVIQVSDGIVPEGSDINNNYLKNYLLTCDYSKSAKLIAQEIKEILYLNNGGTLEDDATVIVNKIELN
ncbi:MAG: SpoIIE family protein phosphatase [Clostridia bacterium]|nr:SpoIIE family protein phosphatase [Clostridia bacterium]